MKQLLVKKGRVYAEEVPPPTISDNTVLVQVYYSCISVGTEISGVVTSGESLIKKSLAKPEKIAMALNSVRKHGIAQTIQKIQGKLERGAQIGYSASGVVVGVGRNIINVKIGDKVACAGAGIANHAEYIEVPINLLVKIPDGVDLGLASTVTIGAIALQGVRRADVKIGEYVAVIGLGILGQITTQLLRANGCKVIGIDIDERRITKALESGMNKGVNPVAEDIVSISNNWSGGYGVDAVIITAATESKDILSQAFQICRKKGRVVLVGVVGMEFNRDDMYKKELDFLISTSYGPGRYDELYEQKGIDYPYGYVRWTENRNMQEYLNLIANNKISIGPLIEKEHTIDDALKAYEEIKTSKNKPLIVLIKYNTEEERRLVRKIEVKPKPIRRDGRINIAIIGAGSYAKGVLLPNILKLKNIYSLYAVVSRTGSNAKHIAQSYGARYAATDYREILNDENIDAVIISTRHNLHAKIAIEALKAGKAVFMEKPVALNEKEFDLLEKTINQTRRPFMVGFNRRFSKYVREAKKHVSSRVNPMIINYQMNAGYIPLDHWVHTDEGGGRIIGEACHVFDIFNYLTDAEARSISVNEITPSTEYYSKQDNVVITVKYADGSVCSLTYTALGNNQYPKEMCQIYYDGKIIIIDDYKKISGYGITTEKIQSTDADKGQNEGLVEFYRYLKGETEPPIPLWQISQTSRISFKVEKELS